MTMPVSTTPPDRPFVVLDTIAAVGMATGGSFSGGPRLDEALEKCKVGLRHFASNLEADAVVSCQFEVHVDSKTLTVAGFGTAVRWK